MPVGDPPQCGQDFIGLDLAAKRSQGRFAGEKPFGLKPLERRQCAMDRPDTAAHPAQCPRQLNIQAQPIGRRLQIGRLFHLLDRRFDLAQGAREPSRKAIGQKTERAMTLRAIPAGNTGAGRGGSLVGAVAGKRTATVRMQRTTL